MKTITPKIRQQLKSLITEILIDEGMISNDDLNEVASINNARSQVKKVVDNTLRGLKRKYSDKEFEVSNSTSSGRVSASIDYIFPNNQVAILHISNTHNQNDDKWKFNYTVLLQVRPGSTMRYYEGSNKQTALKNYVKLLK